MNAGTCWNLASLEMTAKGGGRPVWKSLLCLLVTSTTSADTDNANSKSRSAKSTRNRFVGGLACLPSVDAPDSVVVPIDRSSTSQSN